MSHNLFNILKHLQQEQTKLRDETIAYIEALRADSFEGWSEDAIRGYLTALTSIEERLKNYVPKTK